MKGLIWLTYAAVCVCFVNAVWGQGVSVSSNATISGYIRLKGSERELAGVSVELLNFTPRRAVISDSTGFFAITNVPSGRHRLLLTKEQFQDLLITDILVLAGQNIETSAEMEQQIVSISDATPNISTKRTFSKTSKDQPFNNLSNIAARAFTVEEVMRYAGSRFDPSRLVTNFSGVSNFDDFRNDIVIRGNTPAYLLWQIEELPVENPNHFAPMGRAGGTVPILNIFAMGKADFIKGSFSAQYGNTNSGVFDLQLREGNRNETSYMAQIGTQRAEMLIEGPLNKQRAASQRGSFMISVRASIGNFLFKNIIPTDPEHQDINFKISLPKHKWGQLDFFGIGGHHYIYMLPNSGTIAEKIRFQIFENEDYEHKGYTGLLGTKYTLPISRKSFWRLIAGISYSDAKATWIDYDYSQTPTYTFPNYLSHDIRTNYTTHSYFNFSDSKRLFLRVGVLTNIYRLHLSDVYALDNIVDADFKGTRWLGRVYAQTRWNVSSWLSVWAGMNVMKAPFYNQVVAEPRLSATLRLAENHSLAAGYALNHQSANGVDIFFHPVVGHDSAGNSILDHNGRSQPLMRSQHFDIEYNWRAGDNWRFKVQAYYQYLDKVWVDADTSSIYSVLNDGASFYFYYKENLVAKGRGINQGIEASLEKFFSNGYYGLLSASLFDSKYQTSKGEWRNTAFNNRFIINLLTGREFKFGKFNQHVFFADIRVALTGGRPYEPIDVEATYQNGFQNGDLEPVYNKDMSYKVRTPMFKQVDIKFGFRLNGTERKLSHTIRADLFNVFNFKNIFSYKYSQVFDPLAHQQQRGTVIPIYQRGFIPDITYSVLF